MLPNRRLARRGLRQRSALQVVDGLRVDVLQAAKNGQPRPLRRTGDLLADPVTNPAANRLTIDLGRISYSPSSTAVEARY